MARSMPTPARSPNSTSTSPPAASRCPPATSASTSWKRSPTACSRSPRPSASRRSTAPSSCPTSAPTAAPGWYAFGQRLQKASAPYRDAGLGFGWHNHDFEFRKTADGALPQTAIFEGGPDLEWEADIAWVIRGGADPLQWIRTMKHRITAVHVKDIAPAGENADEDGWADVGHGTVDWKALMAALKEQTNARYYVMEHDNPKDDKRFAERSLAAAAEALRRHP